MEHNNFTKYRLVHDEIMKRLENGEITTEQAKEIHDLSFQKYITEKVETNIIDKTLKKTMTLYHGSNKDLDTIKPTALNMGTRLSKMRVSSFWAADKDLCILWAAMHMFFHLRLPYQASLRDKKIYTIDVSYSTESCKKGKHAKEWLKQQYEKDTIYIYTLKNINIKKVGHGQIPIDEYTLDEEVKPDKKEKLSWSTVSNYIEYISKEDFIKKSKSTEMYGRIGKDRSFTEKMLYRDGKKTMEKRMEIYNKAYDQYHKHEGHHQKIGNNLVIDVKSVKK